MTRKEKNKVNKIYLCICFQLFQLFKLHIIRESFSLSEHSRHCLRESEH